MSYYPVIFGAPMACVIRGGFNTEKQQVIIDQQTVNESGLRGMSAVEVTLTGTKKSMRERLRRHDKSQDAVMSRRQDASAEDIKRGHSVAMTQDSYRTPWESINGARNWGENPWVWVVGLKRVEALPARLQIYALKRARYIACQSFGQKRISDVAPAIQYAAASGCCV